MRFFLRAVAFEISERLLVDREEAAGRAIFRRHVGDGGAVLERQIGEADAEELHELADHAGTPQHLGDGQHEVGRGDAVLQLAGQAEADHFGDQHGDRLAEHGGFRLDAADAPAEHREPVDHGGVAVGADQRVGVGDRVAAIRLLGPHRLRQIFEIDLMADAGARRHHAEIVEGARAPAQERVALAVPLIFPVDIDLERLVGAEGVDHHRMVDDEIDRRQRIDLVRIAAERRHGVAHGGEIDHRRHAGEILHQDARRAEGDLLVALALLQPLRDAANIVGGDAPPVLVAQQIFEQHLEREGQARDPGKPVGLGLFQVEIVVGLAVDIERAPAIEAVERGFERRCQRDLLEGVAIIVEAHAKAWPSVVRDGPAIPGRRLLAKGLRVPAYIKALAATRQ